MIIKHHLYQLYFILLLFSLLSSCSKQYPVDVSIADKLPEQVDFNYHIKPILSDRCFKCHGPDNNTRQANLRLDIASGALEQQLESGGYAFVAGNLKKSKAFQRILSDDPNLVMPTPESNLSLSEEEKALIARWIEQGAEYKAHWSFIPPVKATLPKVAQEDWAKNEIDYFILQKIEQEGLPLSEQASKEALLRRVTLDLTGLPPTPVEIDAFLKDNNPNAYEQVIDRLLASPHYGERLALEWLDVARYADSHGYQDDGMRNTWPWRDWVIKVFNENKPYDEFLLEQLAGDLLPNPSKEQLLATCFNRNHPQTQEGGVVDEEYRIEYVADRTNTFGKALIGITMECARCHDHKYDPISQKDYYSLFAFFNNNNDAGIVPYNGEAAPTVMLPSPEEEEKLATLRAKMAPLEAAILPENYTHDLEQWLKTGKSVINLKKGLVADFPFDNAVEVAKESLNLDGKKSPGWAGIGKRGMVTSYINKAKNRADAAIIGDPDKEPLIVEGKFGKALQFLGDAGIRFNRDLDFDRHQPFSVSIWIKPLQDGEKGPIFNNTNGDFEGYRGWICKLNEDATLSFQLNYVWPDNCIDYKTIDTIPTGQWTHIAMTYDGSSKAKGLQFFINGKRPAYKLLKDNLQKSLLHGVQGSNWSSFPFMLGREKERSVENMLMDELNIYNRQLSELEVQQLSDENNNTKPTEAQLLETYLVSAKNSRFNTNLKQLTELRKEENLLMTDILEVMIMQEREDLRPTFILDRGAYDAPTIPVKAQTPSAFNSMAEEFPQNRLGLAQWLIAKDNPLSARVAVNRFWHLLFGKGIVATQEDFGNQGNLPGHPELLDWLAVDFMENGWDIKAFLKKIVLSATYQQASIASELAQELDPTNDWYSYYPAYRLSAEIIRDNALAASGLLVDSIGGPSVYPYQPKGIWAALATRNATKYTQGEGADLYRRSMYTIWKRSSPPPAMMNFDAPDRYYCVVRRQKTATPLQSLVLMNDPQFIEAARMLAERSLKEGGSNPKQRIDFIFKCLIGRAPQEQETTLMQQLLQEELQVFQQEIDRAEALLAIGEKTNDIKLDRAELAAHTIIASTIMNFDEFVMKR